MGLRLCRYCLNMLDYGESMYCKYNLSKSDATAATCPRFLNFELVTKGKVKIALINEKHVPSDIVDRLSGNEEYSGEQEIYDLSTIKRILTDPEDDTNESCKFLLENFYKRLQEIKADKVCFIFD